MLDHFLPRVATRGKSVWLFIVPGGALVSLLALPLVALLWRALMAGPVGMLLTATALSAL